MSKTETYDLTKISEVKTFYEDNQINSYLDLGWVLLGCWSNEEVSQYGKHGTNSCRLGWTSESGDPKHPESQDDSTNPQTTDPEAF